MARDGYVKNEFGDLVLTSDDIGALMLSNGGDFDRKQKDQVGDVVNPMGFTLAVLFCQLRYEIFLR